MAFHLLQGSRPLLLFSIEHPPGLRNTRSLPPAGIWTISVPVRAASLRRFAIARWQLLHASSFLPFILAYQLQVQASQSVSSADMSFGRPGTFDNWKVSPPARGSFPLDHDGASDLSYRPALFAGSPVQLSSLYRSGADISGECKTFMISYLKCLKANAADNGVCRPESRKYLECRMDQ